MKRALRFQLALALAALGSLAACEDPPKPSPSSTASAKVESAPKASASSPLTSAIASALAEPQASASVASAPSASAPEPQASAAPSASVVASAAPSGSASAPPKKAEASPSDGLPKSKNGVLPAGAADKIVKKGDRAVVKLVEAGEEPRSELSYKLTKGDKTPLELRMNVKANIAINGSSLPESKTPEMKMALDLLIGELKEGDAKVEAKLASIGVSPKPGDSEEIVKLLRDQLGSVKGITIGYWLGPKGQVRDVKIDMPGGVPAEAQQVMSGMNQSFEAFSAPLPKEPIGIGGKWQVIHRVTSAGVDILQSSLYTLKKRAGNDITVDVALVQLAAEDIVKAPGLPEGGAARIVGFRTGGSGSSRFDLTSAAPKSGNMTISTGLSIKVEGGSSDGDSTKVDSVVSVKVGRP